MILRYLRSLLLVFLFFNLIKTAAKFLRTEPVKCPARAVIAKSRARHVHVVKVHLFNYSISRVSYVHSSRTPDESLHYFVLPSENQNTFARSADFEFQLILYLRIETARHLVRSEIFLQRSTQNFEIRRRVPRDENKLAKFKKNKQKNIHFLSLSPSMQCLL